MQRPNAQPSLLPGWRRSLLLALSIALIFTQAIGLYHRIEHSAAGGWTGGVEYGAPNHAEPADLAAGDHGAEHLSGTAEHHCAAVDALALGDGPPQAAAPPPASPRVAARVADNLQPRPQSSFLRAFEARAPPALVS